MGGLKFGGTVLVGGNVEDDPTLVVRLLQQLMDSIKSKGKLDAINE